MLADAVDEPVIGAAPSSPSVGGPRVSSRRSCRVPAARAAAVPGARRRHRGARAQLPALDKDGPARRMAPFIRQGQQYPAFARCCRGTDARGISRPNDVRSGGEWNPSRRSPPSSGSLHGDRCVRSHATRSVDDADQLPGAGAARRRSAPIPFVRVPPPLHVGAAASRRRKADGGSGGVQGQDRLHRPDGDPGSSTCSTRRSATITCPGIQLHASMADSLLVEPLHHAPRRADRGSRSS